MRRTGLALFVALAAQPALAQEIRGWAPAGFTAPFDDETAQVPSREELMAAWPKAAATRGLEGDALARCKVDLAGALSGCEVVVERPARAGFGEALLSLASLYRLAPAAQTGRPADASVLIDASRPVSDTHPDWRVEPKDGDFATTASPQFWRSGQPGVAVMNCLLGLQGTLYDCKVVFQSPEGMGLGQMTLRFAPYLLYKPAMLNGKPVKVGVSLPFRWGTKRWRW